MNITFNSLEKNNADIRLAAEAYYEHILKVRSQELYQETIFNLFRRTNAMDIQKHH